jgi:5'-methylthioadenosine phosphorylase
MRVQAAIIGGTGLGHHIEAMPGRYMFVTTPHGLVKGKLVTQDGAEIYCVRRHSAGHKVPPHQVNYLAVAYALKSLQISGCLASAAVGSLNQNWKVGDFVMCDDFIDLSARGITAFDDSVEHRDFTEPFSDQLRQTVLKAAQERGVSVASGGIYANMNGPRYETPQEVKTAAILGANLVGMTAGSEAVVMRELKVPYACVCVVTNAAAGIEDGPLDHQDVVAVMEQKGKTLLSLLLESAARLPVSCT